MALRCSGVDFSINTCNRGGYVNPAATVPELPSLAGASTCPRDRRYAVKRPIDLSGLPDMDPTGDLDDDMIWSDVPWPVITGAGAPRHRMSGGSDIGSGRVERTPPAWPDEARLRRAC